MLGLARGGFELGGRPREPTTAAALGEAARQVGLLFQRAHGRPESALERPRLAREQRFLAVGVADVTPEVEEVALLALEQHAAAVGTYHAGSAAELFRTPKRRRAGDGGILGGAGAGRVEPRLPKVSLGEDTSSRASRSSITPSSRAGAT